MPVEHRHRVSTGQPRTIMPRYRTPDCLLKGTGLTIALFLMLTACSGDPATRGKELAAQIKVGTTTKADVLQLFGFPAREKKAMIDGHAQEVWTYVYAGQGTTPINGLTVTFDEAGVVSAVSPLSQVGTSAGSERYDPLSVKGMPRLNR